jgi:cell wall-associated NlpC family hydrolase
MLPACTYVHLTQPTDFDSLHLLHYPSGMVQKPHIIQILGAKIGSQIALASALALGLALGALPSAGFGQGLHSTSSSSPSALAQEQSREPTSQAAEIVLRALGLLGVSYKLGGNSADSGLDCSGLVRLVFRETLGLVLPRRAEDIGRQSQSIESSQLAPGDLVFFNTLRRAFSHVGIYIGDNQFVHAPSSGGAVRVESLNKPYWQQRFDGARRLLEGSQQQRAASAALAQDAQALEQLLRQVQAPKSESQ